MILLIHWGRVTHICVDKLTSIASDNGVSPGRRQAIIWNIAGIMLIGPLGTNFSDILIEIQTFSLKKIRLKKSSAKRRPFCLGLYVLKCQPSWFQDGWPNMKHFPHLLAFPLYWLLWRESTCHRCSLIICINLSTVMHEKVYVAVHALSVVKPW